MHISADFVTGYEKFLFQLKVLQKRMQKNLSRFFVAQAVPEIYVKNEVLKNRGMFFFVIHCMSINFVSLNQLYCASLKSFDEVLSSTFSMHDKLTVFNFRQSISPIILGSSLISNSCFDPPCWAYFHHLSPFLRF